MISVSLDALKQAMGMVAEHPKTTTTHHHAKGVTKAGKRKKLVHKALHAVVSLTQKIGPRQ